MRLHSVLMIQIEGIAIPYLEIAQDKTSNIPRTMQRYLQKEKVSLFKGNASKASFKVNSLKPISFKQGIPDS